MSFIRRRFARPSSTTKRVKNPCCGGRGLRWQLASLEPRLLLAADVAAAPIAETGSVETGPCGDFASQEVKNEIVFVDSAVENWEELVSSIEADCEIILLESNSSGVDQISAVLSTRTSINAIHLVSHGSSGRLQLGNEFLDADGLHGYSASIRSWSQSLARGADILVYGCETAAGTVGREFLHQLRELTGADVAGSTDRTGNLDVGGDWELESHCGSIQAAMPFGRKIEEFTGHLEISIEAAGVENTEQMQLLIGGRVEATFDDIGGDAYAGQFETYTVDVEGVSISDIQIVFTNDLFDEASGIDRNLRVNRLTVDGVVYETEAPSVFSTGTWLPTDGIVPGYRESEFLQASGLFNFGGQPRGGGSIIAVEASGSTGEEAFELQIDGEVVASWQSVPVSGATYVTQVAEDVTPDQVRVAFINDFQDIESGVDRNLTVDRISIDGAGYETESSDVFSTGTWLPEDGIVPGFRLSETLHSDGYFQYGVSDPDPNPADGTIVISAAGSTGEESIELRIDGQVVATFESIGGNVDARSFRDFIYQASSPVEASQVRIAFINDFLDESSGIDRNVTIDKITIDGFAFETEADDTFSTGTWLPADGIVPGFRQSETLHADGFFQFAATAINRGFVGLGVTQVTIDEDASVARVPIIRYDGSDGEAVVSYQTLGNEAEDGSDFTGSSDGTVVFADGQTLAFAEVPLLDDSELEAIETFSLSLFRSEGAELGVPRTAIVTIVDDEAGRDLIANWKLDESSLTSSVLDSSENSNDGAFVNFGSGSSQSGPSSDSPDVNAENLGSVRFDGVNDFISIAQDASLDLSAGTFTQSVWIRPTGTTQGYQGVLGYQPNSTASRYPGIWVYQGDRIHAGFGDGTNWNSFTTRSVLTADQWNHVATTFDGTTYQTFVNGTLVFSSDDFAGRTPATTQQVDIGRVDNYFEGGIDDVRIYNRALSAQEINVLLDGATIPTVPVDGEFTTDQLYSGFDTPLAVDWLPDGRMLVSEQDGRVQVIGLDGTRQSTPLLDIRDRVNSGTKDRGMLGFAVHPDFETNPYIYVSYTYDPPEVAGQGGLGGTDGNGARVARISRFTVNATGTFADPNSEFVLVGNNSIYANIGNPNIRPGLNDPHSCIDANGDPIEDCIPADETSHTIGDLEFGPDGMLYVSSGDGGSFGRVDPINLRALDIDSLAGKILRIDPITGEAPSDNPFFDGDSGSNASKVYQYGLRNPFRIAVNPFSGGVFNGDVGWTKWEEINTGRGANFGWPAFEGGDGESLRTGGYQNLQVVEDYYATNPDVTAPIWARLHSDGARAIVMGDFVYDSVYPEQYDGSLLFTDIGDQVLRMLNFDQFGNVVGVDVVSSSVGFLVDVQMHSDGYLYYVDITGSIGRLEFQVA
ncbi:MAG: DUF4347 domain-containing protein [Planctomycetota bacterium]